MRMKLYFRLENETLPIDYRRIILSYIKKSLSEYNEEEFKKIYPGNDPVIKPFTFAIYIPNPQINSETIKVLERRIEMSISIQNINLGIILFNSFNHQRNKKFSIYQNALVLQNIEMLQEREIMSDKINIKFWSPLVTRERVNRKDYYYSCEREKFEEILKMNLKEQLQISNINRKCVDDFHIMPIKAKKVVVRFYEKQMECSVGTFQLEGNKELLEYVYQSGMGSRHSSGFRNV